MQAFGQAGTAPAAWARIQLVRGQSNGAVWQIDSQYPQARLSVGSDPSAGWPVSAYGVLPSHFEIYWDGATLYLADSLRVGGVTLNGAPLGQEWVQVRGRADVTFGQAAMSVETSDQAARPIQTDPSIARRISLSGEPGTSEIVNEATRVAEPSFGGVELLGGESTRIGEETMLPGSPGAPSFGAPSIGAAARPIMGAPAKAPSQAPPPPPGFRPRLGGQPGGLREPAATLTGGPLTAPVEATRMLALDDAPPSVVVSPGMGPPPAFGAPPQFGGPAPPPPEFSLPGPGAPTGGFAAPPAAAPNQSRQALKDALGRVPRRTIVLIAVALVVALLALLMLAPSEPDPPPPGPLAAPWDPSMLAAPAAPAGGATVAPAPLAPVPVAPVPVAPVPVAPVPVAPLVAPVPVAPVPVAPVPVAPVLVAPVPVAPVPVAPVPVAPVPVAPVPVAPSPVTPSPVTVLPTTPGAPVVDPATLGPTDDRRAADLAIAGRYAEALPIYQALALAHPERPEYGMMARVLERRIADASCLNGLTPDGRPCTTGGF